ncbi:hypothetical protein N7G274_009928 [Stereocaulon virgatum]|uniref:RRM domain-containing protein n=1 Tax=Stereocaulon virgatum TaxID=373712 RepID=A0ABR3ZVP1_9LECA
MHICRSYRILSIKHSIPTSYQSLPHQGQFYTTCTKSIWPIMLCLRRVAFRALSSSPSSSISIKARSITSLTYPLSISRTSNLQKAIFFPLQRRYATDEAVTQAEPEADGATEAQYGENSIAASADADADANTAEPATPHEEAAAQSAIESATESAPDQASSAGSQVADADANAPETATQHEEAAARPAIESALKYAPDQASSAGSQVADADANAPEPATQHQEAAAQSAIESALEYAPDQASSAGSQVADAARTATETVKDVAESLAASAGFEPQASQAGSYTEGREDNEVESSKTVYVGNLYFDVRSDDLKQEFSRAGEIVSATVIKDSRGLSKGFGYVDFATSEAAAEAISLFHLRNFEGRTLTVQYPSSQRSHGRGFKNGRGGAGLHNMPNHLPTKTLFIGNISFDMSDRDLNDLFREVKNVVDVRVAIDRRTGQPRGFAHADFIDVQSAERAADELRGKVVCGRPLRVDYSMSTGRAGNTARGLATGVNDV